MIFTFHRKIVIVGEKGTGKSSYIQLLQTGRCKKDYEPTTSVDISSIVVRDGEEVEYIYSFWECVEEDMWSEQYYIGADGFLIFFDMSKKETYDRAVSLRDKLVKLGIVILVGNKVDLVNVYRHEGYYIAISATSLYNWEEPIQRLGISFFNRRTYV